MNQASQNRIVRGDGGQSQRSRYPQALDPDFARIDDKTHEGLLFFAQGYAKKLRFFDPSTNEPVGDWGTFFDVTAAQKAMQAQDGDCEPHVALYLAFLHLLDYARTSMNRLTKGHLDFYYREVLKFALKGPTPGKVHVLFELQKGVASQRIEKGALLGAGKDDKGNDLFYALTEDIIVNTATLGSLRSVFVDRSANDLVYVAPVANSGDGLGGALDEAQPKWKAFGGADQPLGELGFAVASRILRLREGSRTIRVHMALSGLPADLSLDSIDAHAFCIHLTGQKGWIAPDTVLPHYDKSTGILTFTVKLHADRDPVVDYDPKTHGGCFTTSAPILQVLLNGKAQRYPYAVLKDARVKSTKIEVAVTGVKSLTLENALGKLDASKPFMPFGPEPQKGSSLYVGWDELLEKDVTRFSLRINWQVPVQNLATYYGKYTRAGGRIVASNGYFTVTVWPPDGSESSILAHLFDLNSAQEEVTIPNSASQERALPARRAVETIPRLLQQKSRWARARWNEIQMLSRAAPPSRVMPQAPADTGAGASKRNMIQLQLEQSFLHQEYRQLYAESVLTYTKQNGALDLPNEPYTPVMQSLALDYDAATTDVSQTSASEEDYLCGEVEFFHIGVFGPMREHGLEKQKLAFVADTNAYLLPQYRSEGTLYLGLKNAQALQHVSILFQVADGTANADKGKTLIRWSVLSDNHWRDLHDTEILFDGTDGLLKSGLVKLSIPQEATDTNSVLPPGYHWLRAEIEKDTDAVCQLVGVHTNAAEARFEDRHNAPGHLAQPLKAGTITKLVPAVAAVKSVAQPYASFGGKSAEDDRAFYTRVSERLRHKNRAITAWDYERIVLKDFASVYKVKCLAHTSGACESAPAHVTLIVVGDLNRKYLVDPLEPKVDKGTLSAIQTCLEEHAGPFVKLHVENPSYEQIEADFKVRFDSSCEFGYYKNVLNEDITRFLCPWAYATGEDIGFGGQVHKSVLLHFIEERPYVDYVTDFKMFHIVKGVRSGDVEVAAASGGKSILVSADKHRIDPVDD